MKKNWGGALKGRVSEYNAQRYSKRGRGKKETQDENEQGKGRISFVSGAE